MGSCHRARSDEYRRLVRDSAVERTCSRSSRSSGSSGRACCERERAVLRNLLTFIVGWPKKGKLAHAFMWVHTTQRGKTEIGPTSGSTKLNLASFTLGWRRRSAPARSSCGRGGPPPRPAAGSGRRATPCGQPCAAPHPPPPWSCSIMNY
jgi:hypothetical protein